MTHEVRSFKAQARAHVFMRACNVMGSAYLHSEAVRACVVGCTSINQLLQRLCNLDSWQGLPRLS